MLLRSYRASYRYYSPSKFLLRFSVNRSLVTSPSSSSTSPSGTSPSSALRGFYSFPPYSCRTFSSSIPKMADNENTTESTVATTENGVQDPVTGEIVSKNELKRRIKAREKEKEKAEKAAAKAEKEAAYAAKTKDNASSSVSNAAAEEELDPSKYVIKDKFTVVVLAKGMKYPEEGKRE